MSRVQKKLFLVSASPRRRALLKEAGIPFEILMPGHIDEDAPASLAPAAHAEHVALKKARAVRADGIVLAADTIATTGNVVYGKPRDLDDALQMLRTLQNTTHQVITGVALIDGKRMRVFHETTNVTLGPLTDDQIQIYHSRVDPLDKAGACGIQETAGILQVWVEGSASNVMGLPVERLREELSAFAR